MKKADRPGTTQRHGHARRLGRLAVASIAAGAFAVTRVVVAGDSMLPTFEAGDRLVVLRLGHRLRLRPGVVVTVADPRGGQARTLVKRIVALHDGMLELRGDNPLASTDSRAFGPVPAAQVTGRVLYRYGPPERAGVVRSTQRGPSTLVP